VLTRFVLLGPNVNGISTDVPDNCYVDQAAYVTRHGSRYPDTGAYNGWVDIYNRVGPHLQVVFALLASRC
jgi:hypothetical protein